jgi:hypothetical protein
MTLWWPPTLLLLWQIPNPPNNAPAGIALLWWVVILLLVIAGGLVIILVQRKTRIEKVVETRATAAEGLVRTRDAELVDERRALAKVREELADAESELKALAGINITELFKFWEQKERIETELAEAQSQIRRLQGVIRKYEEGGAK